MEAEPMQMWLTVRELGTFKFDIDAVQVPVKEFGDIEIRPGHEKVLVSLDDFGIIKINGRPAGGQVPPDTKGKLIEQGDNKWSIVVKNGGAVVGPGYFMAFVEGCEDLSKYNKEEVKADYAAVAGKLSQQTSDMTGDQKKFEVKKLRTILKVLDPSAL